MQHTDATAAQELALVKRKLREMHMQRDLLLRQERSEGVSRYEEHIRAQGYPVSALEGRVLRRLRLEEKASDARLWREVVLGACTRLQASGARGAQMAQILRAYAFDALSIAEAARRQGLSRQLAHRMFETAQYSVLDSARPRGLLRGDGRI